MSCNCSKEEQNQYKYIFQYIDGDTKVTMEMSAETDIWNLANRLRDFLCSASWSEDLVAKILDFGDGEE